MKSYTVEVVDSLSLLSLKVASNVFDLSSGLHHVSILDQIVRARLAVRDLKRGDPSLQSLLIVGAGVAGIAAALEAAKREVKNVLVVEIGLEPFGLLKHTTGRYVGPYMYEWPSSFSRQQSYPNHGKTPWEIHSTAQIRWTSNKPMSADQLADKLTNDLPLWMKEIVANGNVAPTICVDVNRHRISDFVKNFARHESARAMSRLQNRTPTNPIRFGYWNDLVWPGGHAAEATIDPQYILLAAGMGKENVKLVKQDELGNDYQGLNYIGPEFWGNDTLMNSDIVNRRVSVFGGGDGALQDVLRALTRCDHPLQFIEFLEKDQAIKNALSRVMPDLLAIDRQGRLFGTWTQKNEEYLNVDTVCKNIAERLARDRRVVRRVIQGIAIGSGLVTLFVRGGYFDKSYLLNRFLVHLIWACKRAQKSMWSKRVDLQVCFNQYAVAYGVGLNGIHDVMIKQTGSSAPAYRHSCDVIAVRYGIEPGTVPGAQLIQVSPKRSKQRTSLARVELPFVAE